MSTTSVMEILATVPDRLSKRLTDLDGDVGLSYLVSEDWTLFEHIDHLQHDLHMKANRLDRVLTEAWPTVDEDVVTHPRTAPTPAASQALRAAIAVSCRRLAHLVSSMTQADRVRPAQRLGQTVMAWDLALEGVHEGFHHLAIIEKEL
jgi:hypothetical protein